MLPPRLISSCGSRRRPSSMPDRFSYLPVASGRADALLMPMLPVALRLKENEPIQVHGLLDSGATVNVLPYSVGVRLGAVWEAQTTRVTLAGNLAAQEARALLVEARVGEFSPVSLVFAWTRADNVPLLLGQVNFFEEFDVCFRRSRRPDILRSRSRYSRLRRFALFRDKRGDRISLGRRGRFGERFRWRRW